MHASIHQRCIDECLGCFEACLAEAMVHSLEAGGDFAKPVHVRSLVACAEMCRATAAIMIARFESHGPVCTACEVVCSVCAESCERKAELRELVVRLRRCADACREASKMSSVIPA